MNGKYCWNPLCVGNQPCESSVEGVYPELYYASSLTTPPLRLFLIFTFTFAQNLNYIQETGKGNAETTARHKVCQINSSTEPLIILSLCKIWSLQLLACCLSWTHYNINVLKRECRVKEEMIEMLITINFLFAIISYRMQKQWWVVSKCVRRYR